MIRIFIFSYGSLISKDSLAITLGKEKAGEAKTAILKGYERGWRNHVHPEKRTGLGIIPKESAQVNCVIFEVDEKYLADLDKREYGFERREVTNQHSVNGTLWAYFVIEPKVPNKEFPIALTYVDTVISGCLSHSEGFALEFVRDAVNWNCPFVNDRNNPLFPRRANLSITELEKIDSLLKQTIPSEFEKLMKF
jgi:gamma-glutamylcyclotransferase (GGCT)/AIG2-like uncharacterized protein YtfP